MIKCNSINLFTILIHLLFFYLLINRVFLLKDNTLELNFLQERMLYIGFFKKFSKFMKLKDEFLGDFKPDDGWRSCLNYNIKLNLMKISNKIKYFVPGWFKWCNLSAVRNLYAFNCKIYIKKKKKTQSKPIYKWWISLYSTAYTQTYIL